MATQDYAASIQGVSIRVTRLDAAGNLGTAAGDSYTTSAFMRLSFTPEYEEGDEITEKSASGVVCVTYKSPDVLKRLTMELAICEPDPELTALLSGGLLLRKNTGTFATPNNKSIGWASPGVGDDPAGYGVAIEAWSWAVKDGKRDGVRPYFHWVFPYVKVRQSGDRVIENGLMANTFEGFALGNVNFGSGPDGRWEFPVAAERPYSYARATWAPVGLNGFYTWTDGIADPYYVTNKALVSNVANLTAGVGVTTAPFTVGDQILVQGVDATFDTTGNIPAVVLSTGGNTAAGYYVTYALTAANVTSAAVANTTVNGVTTTPVIKVLAGVTETPSYIAVTDTQLSSGQTVSGTNVAGTYTFNVPGNRNFDPSATVDRIIVSDEDPTA
jgi:hypothetical protein